MTGAEADYEFYDTVVKAILQAAEVRMQRTGSRFPLGDHREKHGFEIFEERRKNAALRIDLQRNPIR